MSIDQDLMNELFGAGASVRDTNLVQCPSEAVADAVGDILDNRGLDREEVEFKPPQLDALSRKLVADHILLATHRRRGSGRGSREENSYE